MNIASGSDIPDNSSLSTSTQINPVIRGRQDYISVLLRLIGMELYKIRRRTLSKVLAIITILAVVITFLVLALIVPLLLDNGVVQGRSHASADPLLLPLSLIIAVRYIVSVLGQVLIIILVGIIVGGEYAASTVRLLFTRGPARAQFLISKIGAALACIVIGVLGIVLLSIVLGQVLNPLTGITPTFDFFNAAWLGHALLYVLIGILGLFVYAMMALFVATLGRSAAAGIAGTLVWSFLVEPVLERICNFIAFASSGATSDFFQAVPDYFIGKNIAALSQNQNVFLLGSQSPPSALSDLHALLVLVGYLILFIGLAWWINERRDITN